MYTKAIIASFKWVLLKSEIIIYLISLRRGV